MKQTTNYLMHLPEVSDYVDIGVLDENTVKIDGELKKAETHRGEGTRHVTPAEKARWDGKAERQHTHPAGDITGLDAAIAGKADKRVPAAAGNLAALDAAGNPADTGKKPGDFAPTTHTHTKSDLTDFAHTHTKVEITDFAHSHSAGDITAGTLPIARGGTGAGTAAGARGTLDVWSKGECLTGDTAAALGLPATATPNDALQKLGTKNILWKKIKEYPVAGAYTWTAPDLYQGRSYYIGALAVGGGGSGAAVCNISNSNGRGADISPSGGASGYSISVIKKVRPNQAFQMVVGAGGASASCTGQYHSHLIGNSGGTSSFDGNIAHGGNGGHTDYMAENTVSALGGQCSKVPLREGITVGYGPTVNEIPYGGKPVYAGIAQSGQKPIQVIAGGDPNSCFDYFSGRRILGAGGGAYVTTDTRTSPYPVTAHLKNNPAGKNADGKGGGNAAVGVYTDSPITVRAEAANEFGSGGGAAVITGFNSCSGICYSGAGADGAVFIYDGGAAE